MKNKHLVSQSNDLIEAQHRDALTSQEMKIVLTLISKVQPQDNDFNSYEFTVSELTEMLGFKENHRNLYRDIRKVADNLMKKQIVLGKESSTLVTSWMSSAEYYKSGIVEFSFDPKLRPYLLDLKQFTSYRLGNILSLDSAYAIRLYELLKKWQKIVYWDVPVEELRKMLGANQKSYESFGSFRQKVLTPALREINDKTDLIVKMTDKRRGRRVTDLNFEIKARPVKDVETSRGISDSEATAKISGLYNHANVECNISHDLLSLAEFKKVYQRAEKIFPESRIYTEVKELLNKFSNYISDADKNQQHIKNVVGYLLSMLEPLEKRFKDVGYASFLQKEMDFDDEENILGYNWLDGE